MGSEINGHSFKNVGVMSVHNVTGDFVCVNFKGPSIGEVPINPTNDGITFFRWHQPTPRENETKAQAEVRYFEALDKKIGLDAVVVFGNYYRSDGTAVGAGIKAMNPDIKVMHVVMGSDDGAYQEYADASPKYGYGKEGKTLKALLGISEEYSANLNRSELRDVEKSYAATFPGLNNPEQLASTIPTRPKLKLIVAEEAAENSKK